MSKIKPRGVRGRDSAIIPPLGKNVDLETALKALLGTPNPEPRKPAKKRKRIKKR
jgi:hypothetical protein